MNIGWPLGLDYDRVAESFGLDLRWVNQTWTHGRFVTMSVQNAVMAVSARLCDCVACFTTCSFTRERDILGGPGDFEGTREEGGTHGEYPHYGLTAPAAGAATAYRRYMALYGAGTEALGHVAVSLREHARLNPGAIRREELTLEQHASARRVAEPLGLYDCCQASYGALVLLITRAARARDLAKPPGYVSGMQGIRSGPDEFIFASPGLGINQQRPGRVTPRADDAEAYEMAGVARDDIDGFYTYDAFTPLVIFALERFGLAPPGEGHAFVGDGRIGPGGGLPVNSDGGLLSEAHVSGWNHLAEITRQLRGEAGPRQIANAGCLQWGTSWGDNLIFRN